MYIYQNGSELKWLKEEKISCQMLTLNLVKEKITDESNLNLEKQYELIEEINLLLNNIYNNKLISIYKTDYNNHDWLSLNIAGKFTTNKLEIYKCGYDFDSYLGLLNELLDNFKKLKEKFVNILKNKDFYYFSNFQKNIVNLHNSFFNTNYYSYDFILNLEDRLKFYKKHKSIKEFEEKNPYKESTAYAIFFEQGSQSGYKTKNGEAGDISTARLFGSDQGANRTAKSMGIQSYDIVEVKIHVTKRMNLTDFDNKVLNQTISEIEKEKINSQLEEVMKNKEIKTRKDKI